MAKVTVCERITLKLSRDEAECLRDVLGAVGGPAATTRRKYSQKMFNALENAGVFGRQDVLDYEGAIFFKEIE